MKATKLSAAFRYNNIVLNKESNFILTWYCNAFGSETKGALPSISECWCDCQPYWMFASSCQNLTILGTWPYSVQVSHIP